MTVVTLTCVSDPNSDLFLVIRLLSRKVIALSSTFFVSVRGSTGFSDSAKLVVTKDKRKLPVNARINANLNGLRIDVIMDRFNGGKVGKKMKHRKNVNAFIVIYFTVFNYLAVYLCRSSAISKVRGSPEDQLLQDRATVKSLLVFLR